MYRLKTSAIFLLIGSLWACNAPETKTIDQQPETLSRCTVCPSLAEGQDTLDYILQVMEFVAENSDAGLLENRKLTDALNVGFESIDVDRVIEVFEHDSGIAVCSQVATIMTKILVDNDIHAYTFSFGFEEVNLSHELVLARADGRLFIFDPIQNYMLLDHNGKPIDILSVIDQIGRKELKVKASTDTVMAEMIIDQRKLSSLNLLKSYQQDPACMSYWSEVELIGDSIVKRKFTRCFACEVDRPCTTKNFRDQFVDTLKTRTLLNKYHEGLVINARVMTGSSDAQMVDDLIQTAIYSQPELGKRVNTQPAR